MTTGFIVNLKWKKNDKGNSLEDFANISLYLDKEFELLDKNFLDCESK